MKKTKNFHESHEGHADIKLPTNRNFGFTVGGIFAAIGVVKSFFSFTWLAGVFLTIGAALLICTLIRPDLLTPLNKGWMKLGLLLFHVVSPVILFILYAICFVPVGLVMKVLRYDPMRRTLDKDAKTYWIEKKKTDIENPMNYQF